MPIEEVQQRGLSAGFIPLIEAVKMELTNSPLRPVSGWVLTTGCSVESNFGGNEPVLRPIS